MKSRLFRLADATSQWWNVLVFNGEANHSISGDAHRFERTRLEAFIDFLFLWKEERHCEKSYLRDVSRANNLIEEHKRRVALGSGGNGV